MKRMKTAGAFGGPIRQALIPGLFLMGSWFGLFSWNRDWDNKFAVFLSNEALTRRRGFAVGVARFHGDFQFLRRFQR